MNTKAKNSVAVNTVAENETVNTVVLVPVNENNAFAEFQTIDEVNTKAHELAMQMASEGKLELVVSLQREAKERIKEIKAFNKANKVASTSRTQTKAEADAVVQEMISKLKIGDAILVKKYRSEETFPAVYAGITISNGYIRCKYKVGNKSDWSAFTNIVIPEPVVEEPATQAPAKK